MARCDPRITRSYAALSENDGAFDIWSQLRHEWERSREAVNALKNQSDLLQSVPWLDRAIRVRTPYVDILNMIQIELLRRLRNAPEADSARQGEGEAEASTEEHAARLSVQAIAAGLRNTG